MNKSVNIFKTIGAALVIFRNFVFIGFFTFGGGIVAFKTSILCVFSVLVVTIG